MSEFLGYNPEQEVSDPEVTLKRFETALEEPEQINSLVDEEVARHEREAKSTEISVLGNNPYQGFIHPESRVVRNAIVDPFKVNDREAYRYLVDSLNTLKQSPDWSDINFRKLSLPAIQYAISNYFGNAVSGIDTEEHNRQFYLDHTTSNSEPINLSEFKGSGLAVCAEKSALAQNYLTLLGYDSKMIISSGCRLGNEAEQLHAYQLLKTSRGSFIYDPTNPSLTFGLEGQVVGQYPAVYPLDSENVAAFEIGEAVEVAHTDSYQQSGQEIQNRITTRIYKRQ